MISSGDMFRTLSEKEAVREQKEFSVDVRGGGRGAGVGWGLNMVRRKRLI